MVRKNKKQVYIEKMGIFLYVSMAASACITTGGLGYVLSALTPQSQSYFGYKLTGTVLLIFFLVFFGWIIGFVIEYYVFYEDRIVVRALFLKKKTVRKKDVFGVYKQYITGAKMLRFPVEKKLYFVLDDGSSDTVRSRLHSLKKDLMKIPFNSKNEPRIREFWKGEVTVSDFRERR